jgi:acetyl esterase/lipase
MDPLLRSGLRGAISVSNARRPFIRNRLLTLPSFFSGWFTSEAAGLRLAWHSLNTVRLLRRCGLRSTQARLGLALEVATIAGLVGLIREGRRVGDHFEAALSPLLDAEVIEARPRSARAGGVVPFVSGASGRRIQRDIAYLPDRGRRNRLDVYQPRGPGVKRPMIVQIHGGGWIVGSKNDQGIPLLNHLAGNGWVGFSLNYRLAPRVSLLDQVVDIKSAIAWARTHAEEYGGDPDFIVVTGGSAGGHLSSLVALTANDPHFQPGFEHLDTSIAAAVPFYGVYNLLDEDSFMVPGFVEFLERVVVKAPFRGDHAEVWRRFSPVHRIHAAAPPMMLLHGTADTLVPVEQGRDFARRLDAGSDQSVVYVELPGTNHAFDVFPSPRTVRTVEYVERFLTGVRDGSIT